MTVVQLLTRLLLLALILSLVALAIAGAWAATHRDTIRAWRQAATIGVELSGDDTGFAARVLDLFADDVRPATTRQLGELDASVVRSGAQTPRPTVVLLAAATLSASEQRDLLEAQRAFAAAGFDAWALSIPSPAALLADETAALAVNDALEAIAEDPHASPDGISLIATGPAASHALRVAGDGAIAVRAIIAVQPIADVHGLLRAVIVDQSIDSDLRNAAADAVARAAIARLDPSATIARGVLVRAARSQDPLRAIGQLPDALVPTKMRSLLDVVRATDAASFDVAWARVPQDLRAAIDRRSPRPIAASITARTLFIDDVGQPAELRRQLAQLEAAVPDSRTVSIDAQDLDAIDQGSLRDVSVWWLRRAGA